jgi:hypothetical protein
LAKGSGSIGKIYYLPSLEFVLTIPVGTLQERFEACMSLRSKDFSYIEPADISQQLMLLDMLDGHKELTDRERLALAFVPFDANKDVLLRKWLRYVIAYKNQEVISLPGQTGESLDDLELYYELLDLCYSFRRVTGSIFDHQVIGEIKKTTSEKINALLVKKMAKMGKKCKHCGKEIEWNYPFGMCDKCHSKRYDDYWY